MAEEKRGCLAGLINALFGRSPAAAPQYKVNSRFLSDAEASFFRVLQSTVAAHLLVCPKVGLRDLLWPAQQGGKAFWTALNKISQKHVDFVLLDPTTLAPVAGLELDDSSHSHEDRAKRDVDVDSFFRSAGLPLLHVPAKRAYDTRELARLLAQIYEKGTAVATSDKTEMTPDDTASALRDSAPICPSCGVRMVLRTATRGANQGKPFYGCPNYPHCTQIIPVGSDPEP